MSDAASAVAPDGRAVANYLLRLARSNDQKLTVMQLLKILFFAHALSLVVRNQPLFADRAQAWQYGPVFPRIYKAFSRWGRFPINDFAVDKATGEPYQAALPPEAVEIIHVALKKFGQLSAFELSDLTHAPGSPWDRVIREVGAYAEIPNDMIRTHYASAASTG
jgi:uncharacterized phage-associated protein